MCANAGIDQSNASVEGELVLFSRIRTLSRGGCATGPAGRGECGRPWWSPIRSAAWRLGQTDVAIGLAGMVPIEEWRGRRDAFGRELRVTSIAVADVGAAGAADLARAKDSRQPAVLVRGLERYVSAEDGPGAAALRRPAERDLFR